MSRLILIVVVSYLLGSIPFGYLLVRIFRGEDVRRSGSGNIGATNVSRKSPMLGVLTLLLDAGKGSAAVLLAPRLAPLPQSNGYLHSMMAAAALLAVLGHMFPVWLKFRGGKGVATGLGAFIIIAPWAVLCAASLFVIVVFFFRYVSLGSIVAVALFPTLSWMLGEFGNAWAALALMSLASLAIVLKHHENIHRLLMGTENRIGHNHAVNQGNQ